MGRAAFLTASIGLLFVVGCSSPPECMITSHPAQGTTQLDAGTCPTDGGDPDCSPCWSLGAKVEGPPTCTCKPGTTELNCAWREIDNDCTR